MTATYKSFAQQTAERVADLINHGLSDKEILPYLKADGYTRADLIGAIRVILLNGVGDDNVS